MQRNQDQESKINNYTGFQECILLCLGMILGCSLHHLCEGGAGLDRFSIRLDNPRRYLCRAAGLSHTTLPPFASCMCLSEDTQVEQLVKNSPASARDARDTVFIPGLGRSPGRRNGDPLQYSCLRIPWTEEHGRLQTTGSQRVRHN